MADLMRVRAEWSGLGVVGPGVSTLYFADGGTGVVTAVNSFFAALKPWLSNLVTVSCANSGDVIDDATGEIRSSWTQAGGAASTGTSAQTFAQGVGGRVVWNTGARRHGRLTRGTTYLAPITVQAYGTTGTLSASFVSDALAAATALIGASGNELRVWSRPHPGQADGGSSTVTSATIPGAISWLSSRKH